MIDGIETFYQQIGNSIVEAIAGTWTSASVEAVFFNHATRFYGEFRNEAGSIESFETTPSCREAFINLRTLFKNAGKKLWCRAHFSLTADGDFDMKWGYEDCDENGFAHFDEVAEHERILKMLNS